MHTANFAVYIPTFCPRFPDINIRSATMKFSSRTPTINEGMWVRGLLLLGAYVLPVARCARACEGADASRWSGRCDFGRQFSRPHHKVACGRGCPLGATASLNYPSGVH